VGFEPRLSVLCRPRSERRRASDLRIYHTEVDRWCPARTSGSRCDADPARTSVTALWLPRVLVPGYLRRSATGERIGPAGHGMVGQAFAKAVIRGPFYVLLGAYPSGISPSTGTLAACFPTGSRPILFLDVLASVVSKP
jgi:hypothetical protein